MVFYSEGDNSKSGRDRECAVLCGVDNGGKGTENGGVAGSGRSVGISWREIGEGGGVGLTSACRGTTRARSHLGVIDNLVPQSQLSLISLDLLNSCCNGGIKGILVVVGSAAPEI